MLGPDKVVISKPGRYYRHGYDHSILSPPRWSCVHLGAPAQLLFYYIKYHLACCATSQLTLRSWVARSVGSIKVFASISLLVRGAFVPRFLYTS
jgi:hypothetical protein